MFHVGQVHTASFILFIPSVPDSLQRLHCPLPASYQQRVLIILGFSSSDEGSCALILFVHQDNVKLNNGGASLPDRKWTEPLHANFSRFGFKRIIMPLPLLMY